MNYIYSCRRCSELFISRGVLTVKCAHCKYPSHKHHIKRSCYYLLDAQNGLKELNMDKAFKEKSEGG